MINAEPPRRGRVRFLPDGKHKPHGGPLKRHIAPKGVKRGVRLAADHPAILRGGTLFPSRVFDPADVPRALIDGINSRKIGARVVKGRWRDMPIVTLTLEERRTCPTSCREWLTCYGSNMHMARRLVHGPALEAMLLRELAAKARAHPGGFVVRLHVLGDFYSLDYVRFWTTALLVLPQLHVFGFTAHPTNTPLGRAIDRMGRVAGDRCWIRHSGESGPRGSVVIDHAAQSTHLLCPMQSGKVDCCGACGLCWTANRTIEFTRH